MILIKSRIKLIYDATDSTLNVHKIFTLLNEQSEQQIDMQDSTLENKDLWEDLNPEVICRECSSRPPIISICAHTLQTPCQI